MKRQEEKIDKVRSKFGKIEKEEVSLEEKMDFLTDYAASHKHFSFRGDAYRIVKQSGSHSYISCHTGAYEESAN